MQNGLPAHTFMNIALQIFECFSQHINFGDYVKSNSFWRIKNVFQTFFGDFHLKIQYRYSWKSYHTLWYIVYYLVFMERNQNRAENSIVPSIRARIPTSANAAGLIDSNRDFVFAFL